MVASFPVYRTYMVDKPSAADRRTVDWAIGRARRRSLSADVSVFEFIRRVLLGSPLAGAPPGLAEDYRAFARRLQQYTAPVAAKGIEDTALYRHHRLISLNDVGGDPDDFGTPVSAFHGASRDRAQHWPHTLAGHLDARQQAVGGRARAHRRDQRDAGRVATDGAPLEPHEPAATGAKSTARRRRRATTSTCCTRRWWAALPNGTLRRRGAGRVHATHRAGDVEVGARVEGPHELDPAARGYETALTSFVRAALEPRDSNLFLPDLRETTTTLAWYGALNGLTLAAVKGLSPGVPDYYQGHETIELTLVDPDNRRPVDYARRHELLQQARALEALPQRATVLREWLRPGTRWACKILGHLVRVAHPTGHAIAVPPSDLCAAGRARCPRQARDRLCGA